MGLRRVAGNKQSVNGFFNYWCGLSLAGNRQSVNDFLNYWCGLLLAGVACYWLLLAVAVSLAVWPVFGHDGRAAPTRGIGGIAQESPACVRVCIHGRAR